MSTAIIADATLLKTTGPVFVERDGERITLEEGDSIYESDVIITGSDTTADILFRDGAKSRLSPDTELKLVDFDFGPGEDPSFIMNLAQGAMRTVSGEVVKLNPEAFELITPRATVGIRGTEFFNSVDGDNEIHAVLFISEGHIMMVTRDDGQSLNMSTPLQVINMQDGDEGPLTIQRYSLTQMESMINASAPTLGQDIPQDINEQGDWDQLDAVDKQAKDQVEDKEQAEEKEAKEEQQAQEEQQVATEQQVEAEQTISAGVSVVVLVQDAATSEDAAASQKIVDSLEQIGVKVSVLDLAPIGEGGDDILIDTIVDDAQDDASDDFQAGNDSGADGQNPGGNIPSIGGGDTPSVPEPPTPPVDNVGETINIGSVNAAGTGKNEIFEGTAKNDTINGGSLDSSYKASITVNGDAGDDNISLGSLTSKYSASITIDGGAGNDNIKLGALVSNNNSKDIEGLITIDGGNGNNTYLVDGDINATGVKSFISFKGGAGNDAFTVKGDITAYEAGVWGQEKGAINFDGGDGTNTYFVDGNLDANNSGSNGIDISFVGGNGTDEFTVTGTISATTGGYIKFDGGDGTNTYTVNGAISVDSKGEVEFVGGNGDDTFTVGSITATGRDSDDKKGWIKFDGGDGTNEFIVNGVITANADGYIEFNGGAGEDTITLAGGFETEHTSKIIIDGGDDEDVDNFHIYTDGSNGTITFSENTFTEDSEDVLTLYGGFKIKDGVAIEDGGILQVTFGEGANAVTFIFEGINGLDDNDAAREAYINFTSGSNIGQINFLTA